MVVEQDGGGVKRRCGKISVHVTDLRTAEARRRHTHVRACVDPCASAVFLPRILFDFIFRGRYSVSSPRVIGDFVALRCAVSPRMSILKRDWSYTMS